jgi:hypothetical protein
VGSQTKGNGHLIVDWRGEGAFASDTRSSKLSSFRFQMPVPPPPQRAAVTPRVTPPASDGPREGGGHSHNITVALSTASDIAPIVLPFI